MWKILVWYNDNHISRNWDSAEDHAKLSHASHNPICINIFQYMCLSIVFISISLYQTVFLINIGQYLFQSNFRSPRNRTTLPLLHQVRRHDQMNMKWAMQPSVGTSLLKMIIFIMNCGISVLIVIFVIIIIITITINEYCHHHHQLNDRHRPHLLQSRPNISQPWNSVVHCLLILRLWRSS